MNCVYCGRETEVINSRRKQRSNVVWRRRRCTSCNSVITTEETARLDLAWLVRDTQGRLQPFVRDKLYVSLYKSLAHRKTAVTDAAAITNTVISRVQQGLQRGHVSVTPLEPAALANLAEVSLARFDPAAATAYRAFHPNLFS